VVVALSRGTLLMGVTSNLILQGVICTVASLSLENVAVCADNAKLPIEVLAIRENAQRLRSAEFIATGTITLEFHAKKEFRDKMPRFEFDRERFERDRERLRETTENRNGNPVFETAQMEGRARRIEQYDETVNVVVDYDNDRIALRRTRRQTVGESSTFGALRRAWFIGTPQQTIIVNARDQPDLDIAIRGPVSSTSEIKGFLGPVLNARSMGWGGLDDLYLQYGPDGTAFLDVNADQIDITDEGDGIRRLEISNMVDNDATLPAVVQTWWCDERQGFQPVRYTTKGRHLNETTPVQRMYNETAKNRTESEFSWVKIGNVWVLKTLDIRARRLDHDVHWQLAFDWKSVNEPVSNDHFDWHAWDLPKGSQVVDLRMGEDKPILIERVGDPQEAALPQAPNRKLPGNTHRWFLILVNVIVLSFLGGLYLKRRRGQGNPPP